MDRRCTSERASLRASEPSSTVFGSLVHQRRLRLVVWIDGAPVSERVFERANHQAGSSGRWCTAPAPASARRMDRRCASDRVAERRGAGCRHVAVRQAARVVGRRPRAPRRVRGARRRRVAHDRCRVRRHGVRRTGHRATGASDVRHRRGTDPDDRERVRIRDVGVPRGLPGRRRRGVRARARPRGGDDDAALRRRHPPRVHRPRGSPGHGHAEHLRDVGQPLPARVRGHAGAAGDGVGEEPPARRGQRAGPAPATRDRRGGARQPHDRRPADVAAVLLDRRRVRRGRHRSRSRRQRRRRAVELAALREAVGPPIELRVGLGDRQRHGERGVRRRRHRRAGRRRLRGARRLHDRRDRHGRGARRGTAR